MRVDLMETANWIFPTSETNQEQASRVILNGFERLVHTCTLMCDEQPRLHCYPRDDRLG